MNKLLILGGVFLMAVPLTGMQPRVGVPVPPCEIQEKVTGVAQILIDNPEAKYTVIDKIKKYLGDETLGNPKSIAVKKMLISQLASQVVNSYLRNTSRLIKNNGHYTIIINEYLDGTRSEERVTDAGHEIIQRKPDSPWHQMTFEEFLKLYLNLIQVWKIETDKGVEK